jgi:hypothetical protein
MPYAALFLLMIGWPRNSDIFCAISRPARSVACPGGQGTTIRIDRFG